MNIRSLSVLAVVCALVVWGVAPALGDDIQPQENVQSDQVRDASATDAQPADTSSAAGESKADQSPPAESGSVQTPPAAGGVSILDAVVCQDVVNREPVGIADVFPEQIAKVYCFCRVVGAAGESSITYNWYHGGALKASVQLPVRSPNWRTWSSKRMSPEWTGEWMVEILSSEGTALENIVFYVR